MKIQEDAPKGSGVHSRVLAGEIAGHFVYLVFDGLARLQSQ
jgi:hypothetical protein